MGRLIDWQTRLGEYIARLRGAPFEYGELDCTLFAAGAVRAMTGRDPAAAYRGRYATLRGGLTMARRAGFDNHIAGLVDMFGEIPVSRALPGDLAVIGGTSIGVVQGEMIYVMSERGIGMVPRTVAERAFRV